jgi:glycine/D-amino acid oxidase-like deaminating enzyme
VIGAREQAPGRNPVLVIGAGYFGAAIAHEARHAGFDVTVVDDGDAKAGSRVASGIANPKSDPPEGLTRAEFDASLKWVGDHGGVLTREWFWNAGAGTQPRPRHFVYYLDNNEVITSLAYPIGGASIPPHDGITVVAAGYRTDEVLANLGVPPLGVQPWMGRSIIVAGKPKTPLPIEIQLASYQKYTVQAYGAFFRVGSTKEIKHPIEWAYANLYKVGKLVLDDFQYIRTEVGYRPSSPPVVKLVAPNIIVATGAGRSGLSLAGWAAMKVLELIEQVNLD